jgi:hypothetical protein
MAGTTQAAIAVATPTYAKRAARAPIGWMTEEEGAMWIAGRELSATPNPAHLERCRIARAAVAAREPGIDQSAIILPLPDVLQGHIAALRASPLSALFFADAGEPVLVDLRHVCAIQAVVHTEDALRRVEGLVKDDWTSIASITMPVPPAHPLPLPAIFDESRKAHVISSQNPNLRVMVNLQGMQVDVNGMKMPAFGFGIALAPSFLCVAKLKGRYFLRDGYHRAYGLLRRGITHVPALVREFPSIESVQLPAGMLPQDAFLGDRPALLPDYLNDDVSVDTSAPITTKIIVVQALEVTPLG